MIWIIGVLLFVISLLFVIFLFASVWQNKDGTSGKEWLLERMGVMLKPKNITIIILVLLLVIMVRMLQVEIGADKYLLQQIDKQEKHITNQEKQLHKLIMRINNYTKEHKRARKYFE